MLGKVATLAAQAYWPIVQLVAADVGMPAVTLMAVMWRETLFGTAKALDKPGPAGRGDGGHGRGLMQIDDRWHKQWLATHDWTDPEQNIRKGAEILREAHDLFRSKGFRGDSLWRATIAAYNAGAGRVLAAVRAGQDPDSVTKGRDYSAWVADRTRELGNLGFN